MSHGHSRQKKFFQPIDFVMTSFETTIGGKVMMCYDARDKHTGLPCWDHKIFFERPIGDIEKPLYTASTPVHMKQLSVRRVHKGEVVNYRNHVDLPDGTPLENHFANTIYIKDHGSDELGWDVYHVYDAVTHQFIATTHVFPDTKYVPPNSSTHRPDGTSYTLGDIDAEPPRYVD